MRWLARVFASAIARRVAYVIVALVFSALGVSNARAACSPSKDVSFDTCPSEASAKAAATAAYNEWAATITGGQEHSMCSIARWPDATSNEIRVQASFNGWGCGAGGVWYRSFPKNVDECGSKPDYNGPFPGAAGAPKSGSVQCSSGCMQVWTPNADNTWNGTYGLNAACDMDDNTPDQCKNMALTNGWHYNNHTKMCEPDTEECPEGKQHNAKGECEEQACPKGMTLTQFGTCENDKNECPAGEVKSPEGACLPGDGQCAQGEAKGKDGTCKRDSNGDGKPDDEEEDGTAKETFSGGDSCEFPPSCSGSLIMCGQARIQWRIDCNTRRNVNIQGGSCSSAPVCVGKDCKAMEYSQLLMQWRTACAAEKQAGKDGASGESGQPAWTKVTGDGTAGAGEDPEKPHRTVALGVGMLDSGGFLGGGGACPKFGSVSLGKYGSVDLDQWDWICRFFAAVRVVFIALGSFIAFTILGGKSIF
ncbi:hypothetical protein NYR97_19895 [Xanthomonas hydrangeae]|uniref:Uncharacterized protein n=1 Tax=Xanthomonas hydrangeae TaxID=2775159 RepID=A0AAU0B8W8_9XANT|nr:hypothetical protein [Xanthomonas hydrangeae]WOB49433.1 hypothetical protein NYR97_19895 [Xanthomonas hydrangeae]